MIYQTTENKEIKIFHELFVKNNRERAKMIINNKQYKLMENFRKQKYNLKIKIKFFDNIIFLNSMFKNCKSLCFIYNFQNLNIKYLKTISSLFEGCNSLYYIDDISNWNINKINDISAIFFECSALKRLPNISKWNINKVNFAIGLFNKCSSLKELPDISKWNTSNIKDMSFLFY